jgi:hypothetical protein
VRKKFLARLHPDGESLVLKMDLATREFLTRAQPDVFYFTEHYRNYPCVLVRMAAIDQPELAEHVSDAWRGLAPKRLVAEHESSGRGDSAPERNRRTKRRSG